MGLRTGCSKQDRLVDCLKPLGGRWMTGPRVSSSTKRPIDEKRPDELTRDLTVDLDSDSVHVHNMKMDINIVCGQADQTFGKKEDKRMCPFCLIRPCSRTKQPYLTRLPHLLQKLSLDGGLREGGGGGGAEKGTGVT